MPPSKDRRMVKIQREYLIRTTDQLKALCSEPQPNKLEIEQLCKTFDEHFTLLSEHQLNLELKVDDDELDHMISENIQFTKGIIDVRNEAKQYFVEIRDSTASANKEVPERKIYEKSQRHNALVQQTKPDCGFCDKSHFGKCFSIQGLSVKKIVKRARMRKLCFICLSKNHLQADCKSNLTCSKCNDKHNTLLHDGL